MNISKICKGCSGVLFSCLMFLLNQTAYAGIAGHAQFVNGGVQVSNLTDKARELKKGDAVNESDILTTSKTSTVQIKMLDGGYVVIRPESQLKIDSFKFGGKEDGTEQSFFSLIRGGLRAITGMIGHLHKSSYHVATASTTIGVRGTDHETYVVVPGSELAKTVPVGTYNKVNVGETTMTTDKGQISILPNQMGFAGGMNQIPQLQPVNLNIFTITPAALPQTKTDKKTETVRESVVLDNAIQGQDAVQGVILPPNQLQTPIKGKTGPAAPPQVY